MDRFRSFSTPSHHQNIDHTQAVISGCSAAAAGAAPEQGEVQARLHM